MKKICLITITLLLVSLVFSGAVLADSHGGYEDGTYRGIFADGGEFQVNVQFTLEDNTFTALRFRQLAYGGTDYQDTDDETVLALAEQYEDLLDYLEGKDVYAVEELYEPGNIIDGMVMDTFSAATVRGNKVISAIRDALNRGVYSY